MQPYGFQVVTNKPVTLQRSVASQLWVWTLVFDADVWLVMAAGLVVAGVAMWWLEREHNEENFGGDASAADDGDDDALHPVARPLRGIGHGLYFSFAGFASKTEEFAPKTLAGRVLGIHQAFAVYLTICFFTANLAVILLQGDPTAQPITAVADFAARNVPACILNKDEYVTFMAQSYPDTKVQLIPG